MPRIRTSGANQAPRLPASLCGGAPIGQWLTGAMPAPPRLRARTLAPPLPTEGNLPLNLGPNNQGGGRPLNQLVRPHSKTLLHICRWKRLCRLPLGPTANSAPPHPHGDCQRQQGGGQGRQRCRCCMWWWIVPPWRPRKRLGRRTQGNGVARHSVASVSACMKPWQYWTTTRMNVSCGGERASASLVPLLLAQSGRAPATCLEESPAHWKAAKWGI